MTKDDKSGDVHSLKTRWQGKTMTGTDKSVDVLSLKLYSPERTMAGADKPYFPVHQPRPHD